MFNIVLYVCYRHQICPKDMSFTRVHKVRELNVIGLRNLPICLFTTFELFHKHMHIHVHI